MSSTTNFLYDGANAVQELAPIPRANLLTGGVDERFTRTSATETDNYLTDALGSTVELTDSTGATEEQYSYGPYGVLSASGGSTTNSYAFTGREFDGLGIDYYRARYLQTQPQEDSSVKTPIGFNGGINLYAYADDDPIENTDPTALRLGYLQNRIIHLVRLAAPIQIHADAGLEDGRGFMLMIGSHQLWDWMVYERRSKNRPQKRRGERVLRGSKSSPPPILVS